MIARTTFLTLCECHRALSGHQCFALGRGDQTLSNCGLPGYFASASYRFRFLPNFSLGRLFIGGSKFHLAEDSFALHLLFEKFQSLVDVIVPDGDEQNISNPTLATEGWYA